MRISGEALAAVFVVGALSVLYYLKRLVLGQSSGLPASDLKNLRCFQVEEILRIDADSCNFKGNFGYSDKPALVTVRRQHIDAHHIADNLGDLQLLAKPRIGEGFGKYDALVPSQSSSWFTPPIAASKNGGKNNGDENSQSSHSWFKPFSVQVFYPWEISKEREENAKVWDKHYRRAQAKDWRLVRESAELYQTVTLPWVKTHPLSHTSWVHDILDGSEEAHHIVYSDEHFALVIDPKWHGHCDTHEHRRKDWQRLMGAQQIERNLYVLALARDSSIGSLRDLRGDKHLALLKHIASASQKAIEEVYGLDFDTQLRSFVHYLPQYFHFHVHFCSLHLAHGNAMAVGKAHLLQDVIENVQSDGDYYAKANLSCLVTAEHPLYEHLHQ